MDLNTKKGIQGNLKLLFHKTLSYLKYKLLYGELRTPLKNLYTKMDIVFLMPYKESFFSFYKTLRICYPYLHKGRVTLSFLLSFHFQKQVSFLPYNVINFLPLSFVFFLHKKRVLQFL